MKNSLILLLVLSIVFSGILPSLAYGETVDEKVLEDVVLKLKELFSISNDYDKFISTVSAYEDEVNFHLNWSDSKEELPNIAIHADSHGNVVSFNRYYNRSNDAEIKLPNISKDEALKTALDFIEKVAPDVFKEMELKESAQPRSTWDRNYSFNFIRKVNDVPYTLNNVNIHVDIQTGEVSNLYINWERNLKFPHKSNIISLDKAEEAYKEEIGLKLVYKGRGGNIIMERGESDSGYYLAYTTIGDLKAIDAKTGKVVDISNNYIFYANDAKVEESVSGGGEVPIITPEEREEIDKLKGLKPIEEVEKEAREILDLDNSHKLQRKNLYSSWQNPDEFHYSLSFVKTIESKEYNTEISINAKTLELMSFYKSRNIESNAEAVINKDESIKLAQEFIKKINPDKVNEIEYIDTNTIHDDSQYYKLKFMRKVDDIYVESDYISIGVDAVNKDINSYNINWYKGQFPARDNFISIDKAYEVLFDEIGYDLSYNNVYNLENNKEQQREIQLVYSINQDKPRIIDAYTGQILDYAGNAYKDSSIPVYGDIDNSYAKDMIKTLGEYGIGFSGDKFNPKDNIKQADLLFLLWKSMYPYSSYTEVNIDDIYKDLIRQNIVKENEANRERIVTKEEGVKFVIRAMNYEKLAEIPEIYADIFSDGEEIDPNLKGHMTLAYGLKIINGDGTNSIRPKYELKREDAVSLIYNYMFH